MSESHTRTGAHHQGEVEAVVVRTGQEPVVVNLDIAEADDFPVPFYPRPPETG